MVAGWDGSSPSPPPSTPLLPGLGGDPAPEDLGPGVELARALSQSARDRLYAQVTEYGLDPFPIFAEFLPAQGEGAVACTGSEQADVWFPMSRPSDEA
jgi:hypothetical protein